MKLMPALKQFLIFLILCFAFAGAANALPSYDEVRRSYVKSDSLLLDRRGEVIHELRVDRERRRLDWTPLKNISPVLKEAVIQAEDKRFHEHGGVDYRSVGAALIHGLSSEGLRGASTITMQLAALLDRELQSKNGKRSFWQKERQIRNAWEIEKAWSKAEIFEAYLNLVTFRGELQGILAASRGLFGKDPHGLDQSESLILASLIRSPNAPSMEVSRRALLLNRAMDWPVGTDDIHAKVRQVLLGPHLIRPQATLAPHVARPVLQDRPKGCTVTTTLDGRMQRFAMDRLAHHLLSLKSQNVKDGALLVLENSTGDFLAYVSYSGEPSSADFWTAFRPGGRRVLP